MSLNPIGMIGLGVMGRNLVLNFADHGYSAAVYDRDVKLLDAFAQHHVRSETAVCRTLGEFAAALERPRCIMMMVTAGEAVDWCIDEVLPHLDPGDILIDGGNSHFEDTIRRTKRLEAAGFQFIGTGVSGGEEGARRGPSLMPGGSEAAWPHIKDMFQAIAARVPDGAPCCDFIGPAGAGHFVKMVHNGIEYADMQLIAEAYWLLKNVIGMSAYDQSAVFAEWNRGPLSSYLIEITSQILKTADEDSGMPLVEVILDRAEQKGTGKWTSQSGLDFGAPIPTIAEAVFARCLSAVKEERMRASKTLHGPNARFLDDKSAFIEDVRQALYASKICCYAQGFQLLQYAAKEHTWPLNYGRIAQLWRAGCIIRAAFLDRIKDAFDADSNCVNLLTSPFFRDAIHAVQPAWRRAIMRAVEHGVPIPAFSSALAYFDGYRSETLPANLLQAQRDYFGAHRYERVDKPAGEKFHTEWTLRHE